MVAGGWDKAEQEADDIHVLGVGDGQGAGWTVRKSGVGCPLKGDHNIVAMGGGRKNELLVAGWIKEALDGRRLAPLCVELICRLLSEESIHWIQKHGERLQNDHFAIPLRHLLST